MELLPDTTEGNFFNAQHRNSSTFQWVETLSGSHTGFGGLHIYKAGIDLLHTGYEGTSVSGPVLIEREDGTLARRLQYGPATDQSVHGTDVAVFAQDRFQVSTRWNPEFGIRVDRDAVSEGTGVAPRAGIAVMLNEAGTSVLREGTACSSRGRRSSPGAFNQFETALDTRYADDGITPLGPPVLYRHITAPGFVASRSAIWDVAYENRLNRRVTLTLDVLHRQGTHDPSSTRS